jgi:hypothetical protein
LASKQVNPSVTNWSDDQIREPFRRLIETT